MVVCESAIKLYEMHGLREGDPPQVLFIGGVILCVTYNCIYIAHQCGINNFKGFQLTLN